MGGNTQIKYMKIFYILGRKTYFYQAIMCFSYDSGINVFNIEQNYN